MSTTYVIEVEYKRTLKHGNKLIRCSVEVTRKCGGFVGSRSGEATDLSAKEAAIRAICAVVRCFPVPESEIASETSDDPT